MKKKNENVCPGCSRHCPANAVRCKRGRAYFAEREAAGPEKRPHGKHKWEKRVSEGGLLWQLICFSRSAKKALCGKEIAEAQLLDALSEPERNQLWEILEKLGGRLKNNADDVSKELT